MIVKKSLTGNVLAIVVSSVMASGAAFAQAPTGFVEAEDESMVVRPFDVTVDEVEDMQLYMESGDPVGEVEGVLIDAAGTPVALVVDPDDAIQAEGEDNFVITVDQMTMGEGRLTTNLSEDSLLRLPRRTD